MYSNGAEAAIVTSGGVFGDGNHETTQLVLNELYTADPQGKTVLDIGTGSGVQAIFAKKWGASEVYAVDIDYYAIKSARDNFKRNGVEVKSRLNIYNEYLTVKADITVANLPAPNLRDFLDMAGETMAEEGVLIFSFPRRFNLFNECKSIKEWEIVDRVEGLEYDAYVARRKP